MNRTIKQIIPAQRVNMGGIHLDQSLPVRGITQIDPFLLIHHWRNEYEGNQQQSEIGVGPHPHRGFAPVTFIFEGGVHHQDSSGHSGVIEKGGTQWMNSGSGIIHSERPSKELAKDGGVFEIIQFWVNAPAKNKMDSPSYQPLSAKDTDVYFSDDKKVKVAVVAGEIGEISGEIETYSDLLTLRLTFEEDGEITIPIPENFNTLIYQLDGSLLVNDEKRTNAKELTWFENDGKQITLKAKEATRVILLAGAPIDEKVVSYGPFVMNSQKEITQAIEDFQHGEMGTLNEKFEE